MKESQYATDQTTEKGIIKRLLRRLTSKKDSNPDGVQQMITANDVNGSVFVAGRDIININGADPDLIEKINLLVGKASEGKEENEALVLLLNEKADECRKAILRNGIDKAKSICESLCITTFEGCPDELREEIKYYRYLIAILNSESTEILNQCKSVLKIPYCDRAEYLNGLFETSDTVDLKDILSFEETDQVTVLTVLFNQGAFQRILDAYDKFSKDEKSALPPYWKYFVGLALFNAQRFEESADLLQQVHKCKFYDTFIRQDAVIIYAYLAKLQETTRQLSLGYGSKDRLIKLYADYGKIKADTDFARAICGQESLVAGVELQTVLNISIEDFWATYSKYPGAIQNDPWIVNLLGTYYELKGDYQNVYDTYSQLDGKHNDLYLFKLMYSKFVLSEYGEITRLYEEADDSVRSARVQGLWLCGLEETSPERFETELKRLLVSAGDNYDDIFALTLCIKNDDRKLFEELIYPNIESLLDMIVKASDNTKVGYAGVFIQFGHGADALKVLKSIEHPGMIDDMLGMEFYQNLYFYKPWDASDIDPSEEVNEKTFLADDVSIREKIADWFIDNDIIKANFLTIKINCLYDRGKIIETLEKSKELYEITKDDAVAANIISLLSQRRVSSREDYENMPRF